MPEARVVVLFVGDNMSADRITAAHARTERKHCNPPVGVMRRRAVVDFRKQCRMRVVQHGHIQTVVFRKKLAVIKPGHPGQIVRCVGDGLCLAVYVACR